MAGRKKVDLPILDEEEREIGQLVICALPGHAAGKTIFVKEASDVDHDDQDAQDEQDELDAVRLNEGTEYLYALKFPGCVESVLTDHPEMFVADTEMGLRGRLRTGLFTGMVEVRFFSASRHLGKTSFEVQSTKLSYLTDHQWMLRDISEIWTELVMDKFAPAARRFSVDDRGKAKTRYQQFAFLRSMVESAQFKGAMQQILTSPHVSWNEVEDVVWPVRAVRPHSRIARNFAQPGPRRIAELSLGEYLNNIPQRMTMLRSTAGVDDLPNQFVKWLLQEWVGFSWRLHSDLGEMKDARAFIRRGRREVESTIRTLETLLDDELFQDVQELTKFPEANQVLQKREGYRYLYRMHLQFDAAAQLHWPGLEVLYYAGQRNVAQLYEYWVYLQLGRIVAELCGQTFDAAGLIEQSRDQLTLRLRAGEATMITGTTTRFGRLLRLQCWFNKSFGIPNNTGEGSWTRPLRPDCSLRVEVLGQDSDAYVSWIHFDAKYRLERIDEAFDEGGNEDQDQDRTRFRREDLLKMHAYKDAIRKSAGAYVIYPGSENGKPFRQYHELLPGLGAFALRPADGREAIGRDALRHFIEDVLEHLSLQTTQYSRARYWTARAYTNGAPNVEFLDAPLFDRPPADIPVLLGYVKTPAHREWIQSTNLYNVRADAHRDGSVGLHGPELGASLLVAYGPDRDDAAIYEIDGAPRIMTSQALIALGYPDPRGQLYLCFPLKKISSPIASRALLRQTIEDLRSKKTPTARLGAPVVVSWLDLCVERGRPH